MASRGMAVVGSPNTKVVVVAQISHDADNAGTILKEAFARYGTGYTQSDFIDQVNDLFVETNGSRFRDQGVEFLYEPVVFGTTASGKAEMQAYLDRHTIPPGWNHEGTWKVDVVKGTVARVGASARKAKPKTKPVCTCRRR